MRKLFLLLTMLIILSGLAFAQEDVIPVTIVEFPLPDSARTYQIGEYRSFVEMDRPFMGDGFSAKFAPFTSADIADYPLDSSGGATVFKKVIKVEKTESIGTVFFTAYFQYTICQEGAEPKVYTFSTVGNGTRDEEALDKCFRNAAIHVSDIAGSISIHPAEFTVASMVSSEYVLSCGKKDKVYKGDEFHVYSKRNGQDIGKLYAVNVKDDITFAQPIHLKDQVIAGDSVERVKLLGFGANFYYDRIFGDDLNCFGAYLEFFRFFRSFRFLVGTEHISGLDDNCWNIYGGLKTMWHLGYVDLSSLIYLGRGYADSDWRYTGGSIKVLAEFTPIDWLKIGLETGFSKWLADHDNDYPNYGGFLLGTGITLRF
ncbi:MAG: hypothetical protein J6U56_08025 [Spirochaetia bacterium]|nr:hypothetical protein [Spirochaetia bacterium]